MTDTVDNSFEDLIREESFISRKALAEQIQISAMYCMSELHLIKAI
jgi:hypothetical protein